MTAKHPDREPGFDSFREVWDAVRAAGACERHFEWSVSRWAPLLRAGVIGLSGGFGLAACPAGMVPAAIGVLTVCTVLPCAQSRLGRSAPRAFLAANLLVAVLIGGSQLALGAEPVSGWLVAAASITSVTGYFEWAGRRVAPHAIAVVTIGAYGVGCALAGGVVPVGTGARLVVQALVAWAGAVVVRRAARMCDELVRRAVERRMAAAAERAERSADRAYLSVLHDTASTTFLMVSTNATGDFGWLPAQARDDLEALTTRVSVADQEVDLADLLESLATYRGLTVRMSLDRPLVVPATPAFAIYHGVREALANVCRHTDDPHPVLSAHERKGQVVVEVCDRGQGFDAVAVPAHRRGLAESIHARMGQAGGRTDVRSAPGRGTTVRWTWCRDQRRD